MIQFPHGFDRGAFRHRDGRLCPLPPFDAQGNVNSYAHQCLLCGRWHWVVPAAEAVGVADDPLEAFAAAKRAIETAGLPRDMSEGLHRGCPCDALVAP